MASSVKTTSNRNSIRMFPCLLFPDQILDNLTYSIKVSCQTFCLNHQVQNNAHKATFGTFLNKFNNCSKIKRKHIVLKKDAISILQTHQLASVTHGRLNYNAAISTKITDTLPSSVLMGSLKIEESFICTEIPVPFASKKVTEHFLNNNSQTPPVLLYET